MFTYTQSHTSKEAAAESESMPCLDTEFVKLILLWHATGMLDDKMNQHSWYYDLLRDIKKYVSGEKCRSSRMLWNRKSRRLYVDPCLSAGCVRTTSSGSSNGSVTAVLCRRLRCSTESTSPQRLYLCNKHKEFPNVLFVLCL